jgi:fucose permease
MIGWILAIISSSLLFLLDGNTPTYRWVLIFLVIGAGHGILIVSLNYSLQVLANQHQVGHAMSMYTFMRALGMCVGVAVGSSLLQNVLKKNIDTGSTTALTHLNDLAAHPKLPHALLVAFGYECAVMTAVSVVGFLLSLVFTFSSDMQRDQEGHLVRDDGT